MKLLKLLKNTKILHKVKFKDNRILLKIVQSKHNNLIFYNLSIYI